MLGHTVHEIGLSVLTSKYSAVAGRLLKLRPREKTEFEGNSGPLGSEVDRAALPPSNSLFVLEGLTSQQDSNAKTFNKRFFQFQHCQGAEPLHNPLLPKLAIQILPAALLCFAKQDTKLHFFPKRGSASLLPS